jgi:NAD(P)-dependent dehydrogenase (short-subunit alcohol dehydrogenase family)
MKTVVITGANRGIGLAFARWYHSQSYTVIALCRNTSSDLTDLGVTVIDSIDVSAKDIGSILREKLGNITIDILINNAGVLMDEKLGSIAFEQIQHQFEVNALGPLRVTEALLPNVSKGGKIALISSRMGSISDNGSGGRYGYRMSKVALNIAGVSLAQDLKPKDISVAILHPGYVQTELVGGGGDISPELAVERLVRRIEELNLSNTGTFWHSNGEVLPW